MAAQQLRVAVIGAGLAGLSAARLLHNVCDVFVLEASATLGGRVKHITGLVPWPVEIGPEFLHGKQDSSIKDLADEVGCSLRELPYPDCYYIGNQGKFLSGPEADEHEDIATVHDIFASLANEKFPEPDLSMAEFLKLKGANDTVVQLAQAIYANDFGCSLDKLGVGECIQEAQQWTHGDTYIVLDRPLSCTIDHLATGLKIYLNHAVKEVSSSPGTGQVTLRCNGGVEMLADYVVVTVPVKVLQEESIKFDPPLPSVKLQAASAIGMSNALKVLLAFSHSFWPESMFDVVCTNCFIPEFWATRYPSAEGCTTAAGKHLLVGFLAGDAAVSASELSEEVVLSRSLLQLDGMFGTGEQFVKTTPNTSRQGDFYRKTNGKDEFNPLAQPASFYFEAGCIVDWSKEPFVGGGYTHPSVNACGARSILAKPELEGRLHFAGEATYPGVNPCMQAAIDTGVRAAKEVFKGLHASSL